MSKIEDKNLSEVEILGMKLKNPIVIASSNLTGNDKVIKRFLELGAGAVITKTIYNGKRKITSGITLKSNGNVFNSTTYSELSVRKWIDILKEFSKQGLPVIPSIVADTPQELLDLACEMQEAGCKALELGISCPNTNIFNSNQAIYNFTSSVCKNISIPVSVKLTAEPNAVENVKAAIEGGASSISISDTIPAILIDSSGLPLGEKCGYSGPSIKPIVQKSIYDIRKSCIDIPIIGIGGIQDAKDILEYLYIGCTAIQICSCIFNKGITYTEKIVQEFSAMVSVMGKTTFRDKW
jgi:dihydroorotate dehydrogenase subfamily 1